MIKDSMLQNKWETRTSDFVWFIVDYTCTWPFSYAQRRTGLRSWFSRFRWTVPQNRSRVCPWGGGGLRRRTALTFPRFTFKLNNLTLQVTVCQGMATIKQRIVHAAPITMPHFQFQSSTNLIPGRSVLQMKLAHIVASQSMWLPNPSFLFDMILSKSKECIWQKTQGLMSW
jgi:hypothetical protein